MAQWTGPFIYCICHIWPPPLSMYPFALHPSAGGLSWSSVHPSSSSSLPLHLSLFSSLPSLLIHSSLLPPPPPRSGPSSQDKGELVLRWGLPHAEYGGIPALPLLLLPLSSPSFPPNSSHPSSSSLFLPPYFFHFGSFGRGDHHHLLLRNIPFHIITHPNLAQSYRRKTEQRLT